MKVRETTGEADRCQLSAGLLTPLVTGAGKQRKRSRGRRGAAAFPDLLQELQQEVPSGVPAARLVGVCPADVA